MQVTFTTSLDNVDVSATNYNPSEYYYQTVDGNNINLDVLHPSLINFNYTLRYNTGSSQAINTGFIVLIHQKTIIGENGDNNDLIDAYKQQINDSSDTKILVDTFQEFRFWSGAGGFFETAIDPSIGVVLETIYHSLSKGLHFIIRLNGYTASSSDTVQLPLGNLIFVAVGIIAMVQIIKRKKLI